MDTAINRHTANKPIANPFVGLRPFRSDEASLFFGRFEQTTELLQKLHYRRFLGIVGSSGCGKSSLIRAGLIPKLKARCLTNDSTRWLIAVMKPGDAPLRNLAAALLEAVAELDDGPGNKAPQAAATKVKSLIDQMQSGGALALIERLTPPLGEANASLLLLVDQFEELFHFGVRTTDPNKRDEAADFVTLMLELARQDVLPIYVVMTMRSDYLGECDHFHGLPEALNASQYLVPRLTRRQRQQAIVGPIELFDGRITSRLVDQVLNDTGDQSDQLPVLQHALMRTWQCWEQTDDPALDLPHYQAAGTLKDALSRDADNALRGLSLTEYRLARRLFQALTDVDERNRLVRRQRHLHELEVVTGASRAQLLKIINRFQSEGRSLLILEEDKLTDDPLVDISHESLIRQWKRLGKWIADESYSRNIYRRLADDAARYEKDRAEGRLWRDPELAQALQWYRVRKPTPEWARRYHPEIDELTKGNPAQTAREVARKFAATTAFLSDSRAEREAELAEREAELRAKEAQRERERVVAWRLRWLSAVLIGAFLLSAVLGVVVVARNLALRQQKSEVEKARASEQIQKENAFQREKEAKDKTQQLLAAEAKLQNSNTELKSEKQKAVAAQQRAEASQRETERTNRDLLAAQRSLEASQKRLELALVQAKDLAEREKRAKEDAQTQYEIVNKQRSQILASYANSVRVIQGEHSDLSPLLAAQALRKVRNESALSARAAEPDRAPTDADEDYALTWDANRAVRQSLGELARRSARADRRIDGVARPHSLSPDEFLPLVLTPDRRLLAALSNDRSVRVLEATTGELQGQTRQLSRNPSLIALSQDGRHLVTSENEGERSLLRVWRVGKDAAGNPAVGQTVIESAAKSVHSLAFSPDGQRLVTGGLDGLHLWATETGEEIKLPIKPEDKPKGAIGAVAFNPQDGSLAVSGVDEDSSDDKRRAKSAVYLLNATTGQAAGLKIGIGCDCYVRNLSFDRAGQYLAIGTSAVEAAADEDKARVEIWNLLARRRVGLVKAGGGTELLAFSPERNYLAMSDGSRVIRLAKFNWNANVRGALDGIAVALPEYSSMLHDSNVRALAFSADESQLVAINDQGLERVWETSSRATATGISLPESELPADLALNRAGSLLVTADGKNVRKLEAAEELSLTLPPQERMRAFAFSEDGQRLATLSDKGQVRVADVGEPWSAARTRIKDVPAPAEQQDKLGTVALSPRGQYLLLRNRPNLPADADRAVSVLRLGADGGSSALPIIKIDAPVDAFAFDREETRLATIVAREATIRRTGANYSGWGIQLWALSNSPSPMQEIGLALVPGRRVTTVAFSPNGEYLLTVERDASASVLRVWELHTGKEEQRFQRALKDLGRIRSITFDRAGRYMVLARENNSADLWEMDWGKKSAKRVAELPERAHKLVFDAREQRLATVAQARAALNLWRAPDLARETCARLGRNLTYDEWQQYLPDLPYLRTCANLPVHQSVIDAAIALADEGIIPLAADLFAQIKNTQPDANLDPMKEAEWHQQAQAHEEKVRNAGDKLSEIRAGNPTEMREFLPVAIEAYKKARAFYSDKSAYRPVFNQADARKPELIFPAVLGPQLNSLCWWGSLNGYAAEVRGACEQAVLADPHDANRRDSRGVARLLSANSPQDIDAAIEDFQAYINWSGNPAQRRRRECLIRDLRTGNPFQDGNRERLLQELRTDGLDNSGACAYQQRQN